jgi:5-methylcytosine-specific restriction endonuclease McrA
MNRRDRPKETMTHCVWRHGHIRRRITGANCWRSDMSNDVVKRRLQADYIVWDYWVPILSRHPWNKPGLTDRHRCFACGKFRILARAHIVGRYFGGGDEACNLHLLCRVCHGMSEPLEGLPYWRWFKGQAARFATTVAAELRLLQLYSEEIKRLDQFDTEDVIEVLAWEYNCYVNSPVVTVSIEGASK